MRSDNGMIGYIIPITTLREFLAGKTYNIEKFTTKISSDFSLYIKNLESLYKKPNLLKTKKIEIKDMGKNGFSLKFAHQSIDGKSFDYRFIDKNERVSIAVICTNDASSLRNAIDLELESFRLKDQNPTLTLT